MSLKKIEDALRVLGYEGNVVGFDLASEEGYCTVKLKVQPIDILESSTALPQIKSEKMDFGSYCEMLDKLEEDSKEATDEKVVDNKFYEPEAEIKSRWKTSRPRTAMRFVYFKKEKQAKDFAKEYEKDFEYAASQTVGKDSIQKYRIRKNHSDNDLYTQGYMWSLEFRMNGKDFMVLEQCENLKKKETGNRAGHCVRYKEG